MVFLSLCLVQVSTAMSHTFSMTWSFYIHPWAQVRPFFGINHVSLAFRWRILTWRCQIRRTRESPFRIGPSQCSFECSAVGKSLGPCLLSELISEVGHLGLVIAPPASSTSRTRRFPLIYSLPISPDLIPPRVSFLARCLVHDIDSLLCDSEFKRHSSQFHLRKLRFTALCHSYRSRVIFIPCTVYVS